MGLLDDIAIRLRDQAVGGLPGTTYLTDTNWTITKGFMPPDPDRCITLFETGGFPPEVLPELAYPTFQVRIRSISTGYSTGREKLQAVENALHGFASTTINGVYYVAIYAMSAALPLGYDDEDRPLLAENFRALRDRTT